jgi:long-chain acyl-CoA synthetase
MAAPIIESDLPLERIYRWERERADRVFLTQPYGGGKAREWTWAEAVGEARRMAAYLRSRHWPPGSRVAILSKNCAWWMMADMAIWMAGHVSVPVYPSLRPQSIRQILEHCGAIGCFLGATDEREAASMGVPGTIEVIALPTAPANGGLTWESIVASGVPIADSPVRPAGDLATIIYTSGTTGLPKGVMHSFGTLAYNARGLSERLGLMNAERALSYLPLAHIVERIAMETMMAYYLGSQIFFTEGLETFIEDLKRAKPTLFISVPRLLLKFQQGVFAKVPQQKLEKLLRIPLVSRFIKRKILGQLGLSTVRMAASGSAPLPVEILNWYRGLGLPLAEGYGMTESLITHLPTADAVRPGFVGPPLMGVEQKLGESDELLVRSPMNFLGYYNDPEGTRKAFGEDGFFRTGDVAYLAPDGQLKLIGRVKEQFKTSKGKYVAPAPIESRLAAHPAVEACCLMGAGMPSPCALVLLTPEARKKSENPAERKATEDSLRALMESVNRNLDPHERIGCLAIVDGPWTIGNGLVTPTLKLKRASLEEMYQPLIESWTSRTDPVIWETAA